MCTNCVLTSLYISTNINKYNAIYSFIAFDHLVEDHVLLIMIFFIICIYIYIYGWTKVFIGMWSFLHFLFHLQPRSLVYL